MPILRNPPKPKNFNRNAELPFELRLEDFEIAELTKYQWAPDFNGLARTGQQSFRIQSEIA
jgi:hypothetical protein